MFGVRGHSEISVAGRSRNLQAVLCECGR
jgi:hypothetical protein